MKISQILLIAFCIGTSLSLSAQKFGYINSQTLLSELPEVKAADAEIQALQTQLEKKGQMMVQELETKYKELQKREASGEISPKALEDEASKLKLQEAELGKFEQEMQKQVLAKRQEKLQPVIDKVNNAIKMVATDNQFTYIFDSSAGILLYAQESMDVTSLVKSKLGI
ncbi:MAG: OmpH family outer membrane protein [Saprospiraceae bacterium]|jgi:outer membrane protein|nr:OmpH family outer membrane protein [Saprospiraceae bacterium]MBK7466139.1 OmpH family outer membrane protein [Saprospiraceae bacterium]MBK9994029.1 OmpH family outer membrane protein [Saprospiraceae bacterium]